MSTSKTFYSERQYYPLALGVSGLEKPLSINQFKGFISFQAVNNLLTVFLSEFLAISAFRRKIVYD